MSFLNSLYSFCDNFDAEYIRLILYKLADPTPSHCASAFPCDDQSEGSVTGKSRERQTQTLSEEDRRQKH